MPPGDVAGTGDGVKGARRFLAPLSSSHPAAPAMPRSMRTSPACLLPASGSLSARPSSLPDNPGRT